MKRNRKSNIVTTNETSGITSSGVQTGQTMIMNSVNGPVTLNGVTLNDEFINMANAIARSRGINYSNEDELIDSVEVWTPQSDTIATEPVNDVKEEKIKIIFTPVKKLGMDIEFISDFKLS